MPYLCGNKYKRATGSAIYLGGEHVASCVTASNKKQTKGTEVHPETKHDANTNHVSIVRKTSHETHSAQLKN